MLSKCDRLKKEEEYVRKAMANVENDGCVTLLSVIEQRALIKSCRMVIENCSGNLSWEKKPAYWPDDLPFKDPNNMKKNKGDMKNTLKFLFEKAKEMILISDSSVKLNHRPCNLSKDPDDWDVNEQYYRIKSCLPSLPIDDQLKQNLLQIVDIWLLSEKFYPEASHLEMLCRKLKYTICRPLHPPDQQLPQAEPCQKELQAFANTYTSVSSLSSSHNDAPSCEGEQQEGDFDSEECSGEKLTENQSNTFHSEQYLTRESESVSVSEYPQHVNLNLREDLEQEPVLSDNVECFDGVVLDFNWDSLSGCVDAANVVKENTEELRQEETVDCEEAQKLFAEVVEICVVMPSGAVDAVKFRKDIQNSLEELGKTFRLQEVPLVPPGAHFILIGGVEVCQENLDTLKENEWLDDVIITATLCLMERNYKNVQVFPILNNERREDFYQVVHQKLLSKRAEEQRRFSLVPVFYSRHWLLLAADNQKKKFCILDSLPDEQRASELSSWFKNLMFRFTGSRSGQWEKIDLPCGRQKDGNSCGYFLLMNAEAFVNGKPPDLFRQCLVSIFRAWLISKFERDNSSGNIFQHLKVAQEESFCGICDEKHREVSSFPLV